MRKLCIVLLLLPFAALAQVKQISLEDIYKKGTFRGEPVRATFDTIDATAEVKAADVKKADGKAVGELEDIIVTEGVPGKYLVRTAIDRIYRYSTKSYVYLYEPAGKRTFQIDTAKIMHPSLSPDGTRVAYVKDNNLYVLDIASKKTTAITTDGKWNHIINGNADWVYEEEFSFTQAYQWSPKGNFLAYYKFDETNVKEFNMTMFDNERNKDYRFKYPKAGDDNSKVEIHIYDFATSKDVKANYENGDIYIPRIKWTQQDNQLVVFWMNRLQNHLKLLATNAVTGASSTLYEEKNKYYIDINDDWQFLANGKEYLFTSEMNGFNHIYLNTVDGKKKIALSKGNYDVVSINGVDEKNRRVYYTVAYPTPMDRNVFVSDFDGKATSQLTTGSGSSRAVFNKEFNQFYLFRSDLNTPQTVSLNEVTAGKNKQLAARQLKVLSQSEKLKATNASFGIGKAEFIKVPNSKGDTLNGWMLKPANFDPAKKYPVLFCNYGGPGSQQVANRFGAVSYWHQMLAQKGFIVVSVDNTGTGFRGEEFKKKTYLQLGKLEIEDQIDAAKFIGQMPFVDKSNIGHWGWSYGGFMSSLAITKGAETFSAAIAVAPVTSWRFYDNIYTERYMRTPQENPKGYDDNSPLNHTDKIRGKYLIVHGTADDNVHFQNATQMISALVKSNIDFESAYYPNKNHGISGGMDNTTYHLWSKMTNWILENMGNENTSKPVATPTTEKKAF